MDGGASHAYAVSFIVTNIPTYDETENGETVRDVEAWLRRRSDIEDRIRKAKLGAALRKLPSGPAALNTGGIWPRCSPEASRSCSSLGLEMHARAARLHHDLLCVPARLIHPGRPLTRRPPPGDQLLPVGLTHIHERDPAA